MTRFQAGSLSREPGASGRIQEWASHLSRL